MLSWLFSDPLPVGSAAPDFALPDQDGHVVTLSSQLGNPVILVFYPGDDTPVCTRQLCEFRDRWDSLTKRGVRVYGINPSGSSKHASFRDHHKFPFPLLVDRGQQVAALYQANGLWVKRTVYLIDAGGIIRFARRGKPQPEEVLQSLAR